MEPKMYPKKPRTSWLLGLILFAALVRLLAEPVLTARLWAGAGRVLGSGTLARAVVFLETGVLPEAGQERTASRAGGGSAPPETGSAPAALVIPTQPEPEPTQTPAPEAEASEAPAPFSAQEAEAIQLRGSCSYQVDKTALLLRPLDWAKTEGPKILIIHSHSCEAYTQSEGHTYIPDANYRTLDLENSVVAVGDALAAALEDRGVEVLHDRSYNDYPSYNSSYAVAREKIQTWLAQYPSICMVIDVHRDALDQAVREIVERDGQSLAPLMLVVGTDEGGLNHPHWEDNLSCGLKLQALGNRDQPSLFKRLSFRKERFNGDLTPGSLIVEVGTTENTLPEARASMAYLARYLEELLRCP